MSVSVREFDSLLSAIYAAGEEARGLGALFAALMAPFAAASAGVSVYDRRGEEIAHTLVAPRQGDDPADLTALRSLYREPAVRLVTRRRLRKARRLSDVSPPSRLDASRWLGQQAELSGLGFGVAIDLEIDGRRVRLFVLRAFGAPDFDDAAVELVGLLGPHFQRAFRGGGERLQPTQDATDLAALVIMPAEPEPAPETVEARLAARFGLTVAEVRVARAMADGRSRAAVAEALGIAMNTLKSHLRRIYAKMGVERASDFAITMIAVQSMTAEARRAGPTRRRRPSR